jgi:hypothetical protein
LRNPALDPAFGSVIGSVYDLSNDANRLRVELYSPEKDSPWLVPLWEKADAPDGFYYRNALDTGGL